MQTEALGRYSENHSNDKKNNHSVKASLPVGLRSGNRSKVMSIQPDVEEERIVPKKKISGLKRNYNPNYNTLEMTRASANTSYYL